MVVVYVVLRGGIVRAYLYVAHTIFVLWAFFASVLRLHCYSAVFDLLATTTSGVALCPTPPLLVFAINSALAILAVDFFPNWWARDSTISGLTLDIPCAILDSFAAVLVAVTPTVPVRHHTIDRAVIRATLLLLRLRAIVAAVILLLIDNWGARSVAAATRARTLTPLTPLIVAVNRTVLDHAVGLLLERRAHLATILLILEYFTGVILDTVATRLRTL